MRIVNKFAVACSVLAAHVDGVRKRHHGKHLERTNPGEDTFDHDDERSHAQMEVRQSMRIQTTFAGEDAPSVLRTPMASGSGPKCATRGNGKRVVSIADQHGDFEALVSHMHKLGLLSRVPSKSSSTWKGIWAGGDTIFVQTGDILDRGPDGQVMYKFLWALQDQAPKGSVVLLTGNHELMVLQGDIRYVTNLDFCAYTGKSCSGSAKYCSSSSGTCCSYANGKCKSSSNKCFAGNCEFLKSWDKKGEMGSEMRKRFMDGRMKLTYQVNGVVFTHAGLANSIWDKIGTRGSGAIDRLNNMTADLFNRSDGLALWNSRSIIVAGTGQNGPMWSRICYEDWANNEMDSDEARRVAGSRCATIAKSLKDIGASRMVIGHCPQGPSSKSAGIRTSCSGTFIEADTYMSIAYAKSRSSANYNMAAMEFYSADPKAKVWVVYAGQNKCQQLANPGDAPAPTPPSADRRRRRRRS